MATSRLGSEQLRVTVQELIEVLSSFGASGRPPSPLVADIVAGLGTLLGLIEARQVDGALTVAREVRSLQITQQMSDVLLRITTLGSLPGVLDDRFLATVLDAVREWEAALA